MAARSESEKLKRNASNGFYLGAILAAFVFLFGVVLQDVTWVALSFILFGIGISASIFRAIMYVGALLEEQARGR